MMEFKICHVYLTIQVLKFLAVSFLDGGSNEYKLK